MGEKTLNQIFIFHSVKFVYEALRKHGKEEGVSVYVLDEPTNFAFFLDDLKPQVVIARDEDLGEEVDAFLREFEGKTLIKKVLWTKLSNSPLKDKFDAVIVEPITPDTIFSEIQDILES